MNYQPQPQRSPYKPAIEMPSSRGDDKNAEGTKLNQLIEEYRRENDRCSRRINDLKHKLADSNNHRMIAQKEYGPAS